MSASHHAPPARWRVVGVGGQLYPRVLGRSDTLWSVCPTVGPEMSGVWDTRALYVSGLLYVWALGLRLDVSCTTVNKARCAMYSGQ